MAYSRSETIRIAKEVKASAESFLSSVCNLPNNVNTFIDNVNSVMSDIKKDISIKEINENCVNSLRDKVVRNAESALDSIEKAKVSVVREANNYIASIENSYNHSRQEDEPRVNLPRVSGANAASLITSGSSGQTIFQTTQANNKPQSNLENNKVNKYLSLDNINSNDISDWKIIMTSFLKDNELDRYISDISINDNHIYCTLKNNAHYSFDKVSSVNDLVVVLNEIIKKEL